MTFEVAHVLKTSETTHCFHSHTLCFSTHTQHHGQRWSKPEASRHISHRSHSESIAQYEYSPCCHDNQRFVDIWPFSMNCQFTLIPYSSRCGSHVKLTGRRRQSELQLTSGRHRNVAAIDWARQPNEWIDQQVEESKWNECAHRRVEPSEDKEESWIGIFPLDGYRYCLFDEEICYVKDLSLTLKFAQDIPLSLLTLIKLRILLRTL